MFASYFSYSLHRFSKAFSSVFFQYRICGTQRRAETSVNKGCMNIGRPGSHGMKTRHIGFLIFE